jgi:hypothetical protein
MDPGPEVIEHRAQIIDVIVEIERPGRKRNHPGVRPSSIDQMKLNCCSPGNLFTVDANHVFTSPPLPLKSRRILSCGEGRRPLPQIDVYKINLRRSEKFLAVQIKHTDKNSGFIIWGQMYFFQGQIAGRAN